jgi:site-specific recombinase XerD
MSGAADIKTVQRILGHESLATTGLYLDEVREEMVKAISDHPITS